MVKWLWFMVIWPWIVYICIFFLLPSEDVKCPEKYVEWHEIMVKWAGFMVIWPWIVYVCIFFLSHSEDAKWPQRAQKCIKWHDSVVKWSRFMVIWPWLVCICILFLSPTEDVKWPQKCVKWHEIMVKWPRILAFDHASCAFVGSRRSLYFEVVSLSALPCTSAKSPGSSLAVLTSTSNKVQQ